VTWYNFLHDNSRTAMGHPMPFVMISSHPKVEDNETQFKCFSPLHLVIRELNFNYAIIRRLDWWLTSLQTTWNFYPF